MAMRERVASPPNGVWRVRQFAVSAGFSGARRRDRVHRSMSGGDPSFRRGGPRSGSDECGFGRRRDIPRRLVNLPSGLGELILHEDRAPFDLVGNSDQGTGLGDFHFPDIRLRLKVKHSERSLSCLGRDSRRVIARHCLKTGNPVRFCDFLGLRTFSGMLGSTGEFSASNTVDPLTHGTGISSPVALANASTTFGNLLSHAALVSTCRKDLAAVSFIVFIDPRRNSRDVRISRNVEESADRIHSSRPPSG